MPLQVIGAHPLAGAEALRSSACRSTTSRRSCPGKGRCGHEHDGRRPDARPHRDAPLAGPRGASRSLERALPGSRAARSWSTLPDGTVRRVRLRARSCDSTIHDLRALPRGSRRTAELGLGEAYQAGEWRSDDLVALLELLLRERRARAASATRGSRRLVEARPRLEPPHGLLRRAPATSPYHYDLGNELFALMLDETMTYSCALFERPDESLADAQLRKLRRVCEKLELGPGDHVLEIGCGWGSFALVAAGEFGARVTGLTLSRRAGAARAARASPTAGLDDRVEILEQDYREHDGQLHRRSPRSRCSRRSARSSSRPSSRRSTALLAPGGRACIQTILVPDERWARYRATPGLDRALRLPRLPDPVARRAARRRCRQLAAHRREPRGDRAALRRDAPPLARGFLGGLDEVRAARLRRALRADLGLLPRLLRGRASARARSATPSWC